MIRAGYSLRETTVRAIVHRLLTYRLIHLRGPPASGKSVLVSLIKRHITREFPDHRVVTVEWPHAVTRPRHTEQFLDDILGMTMEQLLGEKKLVLLIDEAQMMFRNQYLWKALLKATEKQSSGVCVGLFSLYGSPSSLAVDPGGGTSPPILDLL